MMQNILLERIQEELLVSLVEAFKNLPVEYRQKFFVDRTLGGDYLIHDGLKDTKMVYFGDIEALARENLLILEYEPDGVPYFDISPLGFKYYEFLKKKAGESIAQVESTVKSFIEGNDFKKKYPMAYEKWANAAELLWKTDSQQQLTTIGHLCREAVQEFTEILVRLYRPPNVTNEKAKTITRIKSVLSLVNIGTTVKPFLEALVAYWEVVNDLIQRQEHGAQKEGQSLMWEDGRRVIFQTAMVMFEIDSAVSKALRR